MFRVRLIRTNAFPVNPEQPFAELLDILLDLPSDLFKPFDRRRVLKELETSLLEFGLDRGVTARVLPVNSFGFTQSEFGLPCGFSFGFFLARKLGVLLFDEADTLPGRFDFTAQNFRSIIKILIFVQTDIDVLAPLDHVREHFASGVGSF